MSRHGTRPGRTAKPRYQRGAPAREESRWRRSLAEWRLALRIARRSVWRSRGTSIIVALMVLLPVAGFSAAAVILQSSMPTPHEKVAAELGQNEAKLLAWYAPDPELAQDPLDPGSITSMSEEPGDASPPDEAAVRALFPESTRMIMIGSSQVIAKTEHGLGQIPVTVGDLWDEAFAGRTHIITGAAPDEPTEALVTPATLSRLGANIGDVIEVTAPDPVELTITGVLNDAQNASDAERIYIPHGAVADALGTGTPEYFLPDTTIEAADLPELNHAGVTVLSRDIVLHSTTADLAASAGLWSSYGVVLLMVAVFSVFEIVLLAGAAFAVGARRQQRALATLASVGGERRMLYRVVLSQGIVLGGVGGIVGLAIGVPAAAAFMTATDDGSATQYWGFHANTLVLVGILVLAVAVGLISAIAPARSAVKFDVLSALRGSRKPTTPSRSAPRWGLGFLIAGLVACVAGAFTARSLSWDESAGLKLAAILALVCGPLIFQIGVIMCGGFVLRAVARVLSPVSLGARMASRDSAANTSRAVPAFASVMVTAFLAVTAIVVGSALATQSDTGYQYQTMPGQAKIYVSSDDDPGTLDGVSGVTGAVESDLDAAEVSTFHTPEIQWDDETGTATAGDLIVPAVPAGSRCPTDPLSPEYTDDTSTYAEIMDSDPRCGSHAQHVTLNHEPITVTDTAGLTAWYGGDVPQEALEAFRAGSIIVGSDLLVTDGEITLEWWDPNTDWNTVVETSEEPQNESTFDAFVLSPPKPLWTQLLVPRDTAESLGIDLQPSYVVATPGAEAFAQAQIDKLNLDLEGMQTSASVETGPPQTILYIIIATFLIAGVLFVCASAVAIGLSRADGRADDATLAAVGATRLLRRSFAFWQAIALVVIGTIAGTAAGLLISYALSLAGATGGGAFSPPMFVIAALALGMPLVIAIGSWLVASKPVALVRRAAIG
ncbi:FtsX-like permease family protein [Microbacterium sp. MPKO10]|uniref:FtsX-like permease family protein n=1 Tax=Microbacterium sp. MPKO10 TaxID=2989818 RepID=UPI00223631B4|nr:FtsX-like permease family protein [Microbacterium sp. MPKO10]MCW4457178.1 hypothetical protein [Microbacterium sp. MPKO10]